MCVISVQLVATMQIAMCLFEQPDWAECRTSTNMEKAIC